MSVSALDQPTAAAAISATDLAPPPTPANPSMAPRTGCLGLTSTLWPQAGRVLSAVLLLASLVLLAIVAPVRLVGVSLVIGIRLLIVLVVRLPLARRLNAAHPGLAAERPLRPETDRRVALAAYEALQRARRG
jgi:hypothetical protein